jgi:hypothetical protein
MSLPGWTAVIVRRSSARWHSHIVGNQQAAPRIDRDANGPASRVPFIGDDEEPKCHWEAGR